MLALLGFDTSRLVGLDFALAVGAIIAGWAAGLYDREGPDDEED